MDPDALSHLIIIFLASFQACTGFGFHHYRILPKQHKSHGHVSGPVLGINHRFPPWKPHRFWGKRKRSGNPYLTPEGYRISKRFLHYSPYVFEYFPIFPISKASRATKSRKFGLTSVRSPLESIVKKPFILQALDALPSFYDTYSEHTSPLDKPSQYVGADRPMTKESVQLSEMSENLRPDPPLYEKKPQKINPFSVVHVPPFSPKLASPMQGKIKDRNMLGFSSPIDNDLDYVGKEQRSEIGKPDNLEEKLDFSEGDHFPQNKDLFSNLRQNKEDNFQSQNNLPSLDVEKDEKQTDSDESDVFEIPFTRSNQNSFLPKDDSSKEPAYVDADEFFYNMFHPGYSVNSGEGRDSFKTGGEEQVDGKILEPIFKFEDLEINDLRTDKDKDLSLKEKLDILNDPNWNGKYDGWSAPKIDLTKTNIQPGQMYSYKNPIGFVDETSGCAGIETQTCSMDSECSGCLGLYYCVNNKCSTIPSVPQPQRDSGSQDMGSLSDETFPIED